MDPETAIAVTVFLHLGTMFSLFLFFFKDILKGLRDIKLIMFILIVTLITGVIGITGRRFFESLFSSVSFVAAALFITGIVLLLAQKSMNGKRKQVNLSDAIILGITQSVAIIPGISRSGATISALLFKKIDKIEAFRLSFLAAIPAITGAALLEAKEISIDFKGSAANLLIGAMVSFLSGLLALYFLKTALQKAKLHYFGYYCIIIAVLAILFVR